MHQHYSSSSQKFRSRICLAIHQQVSADLQASQQIRAAVRSVAMAQIQHHKLQDTSAVHSRISPAPFSIGRRQATPLRIFAAARQQQMPAHCIQQAGKRVLLAIGSAAVVLSSAIGLPVPDQHACMMWHVVPPKIRNARAFNAGTLTQLMTPQGQDMPPKR